MDSPLVYFAAVLTLGALAQWLAWRLRLPSILLLLGLGFALGQLPGVAEAIRDENIEKLVLFPLVSLAVGVILFEGGLTLRLSEVRQSGGVVLRLVTLAVLITWLLTAAACRWLLNFEPSVALLAGAIFTVSGPTVVAPLLRHIRPAGRIGSIVKWEGILNDPIGAVLAVVVFEAVIVGGASAGFVAGVGHVVAALLAGTFVGGIAAWLLVQTLKRFLVPDFLHVPLFVAAIVAAYSASNQWFHESGLVAVTVLGIALANQRTVAIRHVAEFKENLQVLLIAALFIILTSRLKYSDLQEFGWAGLGFLAALILLIRPVAVFVSTIFSDLKWKERIFLACMAPRGIVAVAVSSVFALTVVETQSNGAISAETAAGLKQLVPLTFLVIVGTVGVYGLLAAPIARWLGLSEPSPQGVLFAGADASVRAIAAALQEEGYQAVLVDVNHHNIAAARMQGLPTCDASILSEYAQEELDLAGIGRLLAMTQNNEVNSLATLAFGHHFGRADVFQLVSESDGPARKEAASYMQGRQLFGQGVTYHDLERRFSRDAQIKKTKLTEEFTYEDYRAMYGESAVLLFRIQDSGKLVVCIADDESTPQPGETLIGLVERTEDLESRPKRC